MNIVFISTYLPATYIGGAEILTELVTGELARRGHNVTIYTGGIESTTEASGVRIQRFPILQPKSLRTFLSPARSLAFQHLLQRDPYFIRADIVHAVDIDTLSLLSHWKGIQHRLLATIQDYGMVCPAGDLLYGQKQCPNYCHKNQGFLCLNKRNVSPLEKSHLASVYYIRKHIRDKVLSRLQYTICVSRFVENELLRVAPHINSRVIGNCVSNAWFSSYKKKKDIDILYVGRLVWHKGVDILFRALSEIVKKRRISVYFIGSGDHSGYTQMLMNYGLQECVTLMEAVPHDTILPYYHRAQIVVAPSIWPEPCGRTIIEGMATGCAVVATHTGGTPESIQDGITGILVPPGNYALLSRAIEKLLLHPGTLRRVGYNARLYAKKHFLTQTIVKQYEQYYRLILSR